MRKLLVFVLPALLAAYAMAQPCSNADLRGTYLFQAFGWTSTPDPAYAGQMVPMRGLGLLYYDGNGSASGKVTTTVAGVQHNLEFVGLTYTINSDCTGTAQYQTKNLDNGVVMPLQKHKLLLSEDGNLLRTLMTDSGGGGTIIGSEIRRLSRGPRACDQSMIRGTYAMHYADAWFNMQIFNPTQNYFAPALGVGVFHVDPAGTNTGSGTHNMGGLAMETQLVSGTWTVNADCTGIFDATALNKTFGQTMRAKSPLVVTGDGAQMIVLAVGTDGFQYFDRIAIP